MMVSPSKQEEAFIRSHRVARMATADRGGRPHVVPICYVYDGDAIYSAIDEKPKRASVSRLKRLRNLDENRHVALVIDDYHEEWSKLAFVMIQGEGKILLEGHEYQRAVTLLREKYPQYRTMRIGEEERPVIKIVPARIISWGAV